MQGTPRLPYELSLQSTLHLTSGTEMHLPALARLHLRSPHFSPSPKNKKNKTLQYSNSQATRAISRSLLFFPLLLESLARLESQYTERCKWNKSELEARIEREWMRRSVCLSGNFFDCMKRLKRNFGTGLELGIKKH